MKAKLIYLALSAFLLAGALSYSDSVVSQSTAENVRAQERKIAYLTFDDGPSDKTAAILDVLKSRGVRATFFVCNQEYPEFETLLQREKLEGHAVGNHTLSHDYKKIYQSSESFIADVKLMDDEIARAIGEPSGLLRFPGGTIGAYNYSGDSGNFRSIIDQAEQNGYLFFDWNVSADDQIQPFPTARTVAERITAQCAKTDSALILLHDTYNSENVVEALPDIIDNLTEMGFEFRALDETAPRMLQYLCYNLA